MSRAARRRGRGALELIEDAFHELRHAPAGALAAYVAGALPFLLALLYFWADMSQSAFAAERAGEGALAVALLFLWLKLWQTVFVSRLGGQTAGWTIRRGARALLVQAAIQPSGLFLLPIALCLVLPFGWVFAFYQNVTVIGDGAKGMDLRSVVRVSAQRAGLWPRQNHAAILILALCGLFLFLNFSVALFFAPHLLRILLGIETTLSRSGISLLNTTFLAIVLALVFLFLDPLIKAIYRLRCFEGGALQTADDLKTRWREGFPHAKLLAALLLLLFLSPASARAGNQEAKPAGTNVRAGELDRSIERVLQKRDYAWRMKRDAKAAEEEEAWLASFARSILRFFQRVYRTLSRWYYDVVDWLDRLLRPKGGGTASTRSSGVGWIFSAHGLLLLLLAAVACTLALVLIRRKRRRKQARPAAVQAPATTERLEDDLAAAADLPEDEWRARARGFLSAGDLRQAVRALYLGSLALLASKGALTLARFKSNRDYARELERRQRARPGVPFLFAENVLVFERIWYGRHAATEEALDRLDRNLDGLKAQLES